MMNKSDAIPPLEELAAILGTRGFSRDPDDMAPWLTDWRQRYQGRALAMVSPATLAEVVAVVRFAAAHRLPIVPQGGNTSMVAGAVPDDSGRALLLSMRRMNKIRSIRQADNAMVVEAGVILTHVHEAALEVGLRFPLSLGAKGSATIGGLVSTNAGGTQVLRFGPMRALVLGIEAVLPDGSVIESLASLRKDNRGYDLRQLLCGAEGTLGVVTAVTLRLVPVLRQRVVAWVGLDSPQAALDLLRRLEQRLGDSVEGFELVPDIALELVLRHIPGTRAPLATDCPWYVLVECGAVTAGDELQMAFGAVLEDEINAGRVTDAMIAANGAQAEALWHLRDSISEAERHDGTAAKHDVSVAVSDMPRFVMEAAAAVEQRFPGVRVIAFGHLGDGNVHFNVRAALGADSQAWLVREGHDVTAFVDDLVVKAGGSLSAEHGIGQIKLAEFARISEPARLNMLRAIKQALDPHGIMNPGKLLPLAPEDSIP
nr:FAD-binding oxidoreductase [Aquisediminimonas sediminicola]